MTTATEPIAPSVDATAVLTLDGVAAELGYSRTKIWRMRSAGELLDPVTEGRRPRWSLVEVREWIAAGCPGASAWRHEKGRMPRRRSTARRQVAARRKGAGVR